MNQLDRIAHMEQILDEATDAVSAMEDALERYRSVQEKLQELEAYYTSQQWRRDFDDDCSGKIPGNLNRGVLSEDAVYNLLEQDAQLRKALRDTSLPKMS